LAKFNLRETITKVKKNWNQPNEGEYLSLKEFMFFCFGGMGIGTVSDVVLMLNFAGTCIVIGMIFNIGIRDAVVINAIGLGIEYILLSHKAIITDNLGRLPKRQTRGVHALFLGLLALAGVLWTLPSAQFDYLLKDLFKHVALKIICTVISLYLLMYVLKFFAKKYGKFKPTMVLYGLPTLIFATLLVYLPYKDMKYSSRLLMVHLITNLIAMFRIPYNDNIDKMKGLLSSNPQERVRIYAIAPILVGLLRSIFGMIFPVVATLTGGQLNINTYRWVIPVFGGLGLLQGFLIIKAKERVIQPVEFKPKVDFKKALREVFTNKYLWIRNISDLFNDWAGLAQGVLGWILIYGTRMEWLTGIMLNLSYITMTPGNLLAPAFTKRFSKRKAMLGLRAVIILFQFGYLAIIYLQSDVMKITAFMAASLVVSLFNATHNVIKDSTAPDVWDYQQWRTGERLEASSDMFDYLKTPLRVAIGFFMPFVLKLVGLVSDWDILYDAEIRNQVITLHIVISIVGLVLMTLPFIFWDLTPNKHQRILDDLKERAGVSDESQEAIAEEVTV